MTNIAKGQLVIDMKYGVPVSKYIHFNKFIYKSKLTVAGGTELQFILKLDNQEMNTSEEDLCQPSEND